MAAGADKAAGRRPALKGAEGTLRSTRYTRANGEVLTRATVYMPEDLHRRLKVRCVQEGRDVSEVVTELVQAWCDGW